MPTPYTVTITISNGSISCQPNGGNLQVAHGDPITWNSDKDCTLVFYPFKNNKKGNKEWPFDEQEPAWPQKKCKGTRSKGSGTETFKYTVKATGCTDLDPIIIVDK
ncbi:MAG: hypothetical protein JO184_17675 [Gammaproteobacteria bacterium]|nr:hypothetical protein [Gammaproteobacteria bacterium]MBV8306500.1 hypothetical protein [Gammaproteobacteria bacterium]MBV8405323.1 hypothetical protein [Gammaproteobacteria bacterium]